MAPCYECRTFFRLFNVSPRSRTPHGDKNPCQEEIDSKGQISGKALEARKQTKARSSCARRKTCQCGSFTPGRLTKRIGERTRRPRTPPPGPPSDAYAEAPGNSQRD